MECKEWFTTEGMGREIYDGPTVKIILQGMECKECFTTDAMRRKVNECPKEGRKEAHLRVDDVHGNFQRPGEARREGARDVGKVVRLHNADHALRNRSSTKHFVSKDIPVHNIHSGGIF
jgi:hypothetical protein